MIDFLNENKDTNRLPGIVALDMLEPTTKNQLYQLLKAKELQLYKSPLFRFLMTWLKELLHGP